VFICWGAMIKFITQSLDIFWLDKTLPEHSENEKCFVLLAWKILAFQGKLSPTKNSLKVNHFQDKSSTKGFVK
jgi:hypothetical protein